MSDAAAIRLVVSDVDGTLVRKDKSLSSGVIAAAARLKAAGVGFTLISARPPSGIVKLAEALDIDLPLAAYNGGTLFQRDGTVLERHRVPEDVVAGLFQLIDGRGATPWVFADGRWHARDPDNPHVSHERIASDQDPDIRDDLTPFYGSVDKLTFVSDDAALLHGLAREAIAAFGDRTTIGQSQTYYLDVTATQANKGDGIAALARRQGVALGDVAAFGDMDNDLPMFARAGFSVAMGQAPDPVRNAADAVSTSNEEDGVAHAIDTFILPRVSVAA